MVVSDPGSFDPHYRQSHGDPVMTLLPQPSRYRLLIQTQLPFRLLQVLYKPNDKELITLLIVNDNLINKYILRDVYRIIMLFYNAIAGEFVHVKHTMYYYEDSLGKDMKILNVAYQCTPNLKRPLAVTCCTWSVNHCVALKACAHVMLLCGLTT